MRDDFDDTQLDPRQEDGRDRDHGDEVDSINLHREAGLKMIAFMYSAFNYVHQAKTQNEMAIRFWAVSAAIDHPALNGRPHLEIAAELGTTRANFSKHVVTFENQNDLPPTLSQKSNEARASYSEARKAQLS